MKEGVNGVHTCDDCESNCRAPSITWRLGGTLCDNCRMRKCQSTREIDKCKSCTKMVAPLILEQNKVLHDENTSLKEKVKRFEENLFG